MGNKAGAYGHPLEFDLISDLHNTATQLVFSVVLVGGGITNTACLPPIAATNVWTHFSVTLQTGAFWTNAATGLASTAGDLVNCLSALESLDIAGEFGTGPDTGGIDNVILWGRFTYYQSFDSGVYDPNFTLVGSTNWVYVPPGHGVGADATNGMIRLYNLSNDVSEVFYVSKFVLSDDFEVTVDYDRSAAGGSTGILIVWFAGGGLLDIYHDGSYTCCTFGYPGVGPFPSARYPVCPTRGTYRLRRVGTTFYGDADLGSGFINIGSWSDPTFTAPARVGLEMYDHGGGAFPRCFIADNLSVRADALVPLQLEIQRGANSVVLSWPAAANCWVEVRPALVPLPAWATMTNAAVLNGWLYNMVVTNAEPARFFRLNWPSSYY